MPSVLHVSASDAVGGSARSAYRLHSGLRDIGWRSRMLVGDRSTDDADVRPLKRNVAWRAADRAAGTVTNAFDLQYVFYPSSFGVVRDPWFREADVVQLFNLHGGYFSHSALPLLTRRRPTIWRLSDQWAFTGHVVYSYECDRWRHGCGSCPHLHDYPALKRDTTALLWRWKRRVYARSALTIVAPSRWIEGLAKESPLLGSFPVHRIANGVDLDVFRPVDKAEARSALGLDPARPTVLFSAPDLADRRKGGAVLRAALARLEDADFDLVVAGANAADLARPARALGALDEGRLALAYAAADMFVLPTLQENLPNSVLESMASGTPVVASDVGGVPDAVRHLDNGYLVPPAHAGALAEGIRTLLGDGELRARLSASARATVENEFGSELEARRFAELYEEVLASA
jgi:glycosyltransferase involved in cell wall biosynthesis